jgi:enoyl-CoA hydratase/carnithine racemase
MEIPQRDHGSVLLTEAAEVPFERVKDMLGGLTDGYQCRAITFVLGESEAEGTLSADDLLWLERYPIPLIGALSGDLSGQAALLALGMDIRVGQKGFSIRTPGIGSRRLLRLLGEAGSVRSLEGGGRLDSEGALETGLVSALIDDAEAEALRLAEVIASRGPIATRFGKEALWRGVELPLPRALRMETDLTILLQSTKDRAEGVRAFVEKRPPVFTGD